MVKIHCGSSWEKRCSLKDSLLQMYVSAMSDVYMVCLMVYDSYVYKVFIHANFYPASNTNPLNVLVSFCRTLEDQKE